VGTLAFAWEREIPFVPLLWLPYLSIDLFFVAAPFLCRTEAALERLARRLVVAILLSAAGFLLLPLRLRFDPPAADGPVAALHAAVSELVGAHNLFPSLHVGLAALLWPVYRDRTAGPARGLLGTWFALIVASTVLTHQHHVADVAGGLGVAALAAALFPARPAAPGRNPQRAALYGLLAAAAAGLGWALRPWALPLAWPAAALAAVALAYAGLGPAVFGKTGGQVPWGRQLLFAPYLAGQAAVAAWYRRRMARWAEVAPGVLLGRRLDADEADVAVRCGVRAVLDLTAETSETRAFRQLRYANVPLLDLTLPTPAQLDAAVLFIRAARSRGAVYVHCKLGYARGAVVVAAYLVAEGHAPSPEDAVARVHAVRPGAVLGPEVTDLLRAWHAGQPAVGPAGRPRPVEATS
jgi:membrane-associated phospholipid phosphatase